MQVPDQDADAAVRAGVPPLTANALLRLQLPQNCRKGELTGTDSNKCFQVSTKGIQHNLK